MRNGFTLMSRKAQITGNSNLFSIACSGAQQWKHQRSLLLAFVGESSGLPWFLFTESH